MPGFWEHLVRKPLPNGNKVDDGNIRHYFCHQKQVIIIVIAIIIIITTSKKEWSLPIITIFFNRHHDICDIVSQMALHQQRRKRMDGEHDYRKPVFRISPKTVSEILDFLAWLPIDWKSCWFWIIQKCFGDITYFQ